MDFSEVFKPFQLIVACPAPEALTLVTSGCDGVVAGVMCADASDGSEVPATFVAITLNV
jgi:hypothetical protein